MKDIFDGIILCQECRRQMKKGQVFKDGFRIRFAYCNNCNERLWHPGDISEYEHFKDLKRKEFKVKLRLVGNSYAVSIPREIINFIQDIERDFSKHAKEEVRLMMNELGRLSIIFEDIESKIKQRNEQ